jgi:ribose transport system substrate-binding protein
MYLSFFRQICPIAIIFLNLLSLLPSMTHADTAYSAPYDCAVSHEVDLQVWTVPTSGPKVQGQKTIAFVASDMRNGGVDGVARGIVEAIQMLGWRVVVFDGNGGVLGQATALLKAVSIRPDGIVLAGLDAQTHQKTLAIAKKNNITVVGWHAMDTAGANNDLGLFTNITTDAEEVARVAACFAIDSAKGKANVVILTDTNFSIARAKSNKLNKVINSCTHCRVLVVKDVPLANTAEEMSSVLQELVSQFGDEITHIIGINDLYFDYAKLFFEKNKTEVKIIPKMISAGDGSRTAYQRIQVGVYQVATVPEPLVLQGWQAIDELNRAFNLQPPSGFSAPVDVITQKNLTQYVIEDTYDPNNQYRQTYSKVWDKESL